MNKLVLVLLVGVLSLFTGFLCGSLLTRSDRIKCEAEMDEQVKKYAAMEQKNQKLVAEKTAIILHKEGELRRLITEVEQKEKEIAEEARRKAEEPARLAVERKERIESGFSFWDGSHIQLTRHIKELMNDPKSYSHDKTVYWDSGDHLIVLTHFRGKNAFGGIVRNWIKAKCDLDGKVIEVIEQGPSESNY